jgi:long-chain acyl-CoA synthetase
MNYTFNRLFEESIRRYWDSPAFTDYRKGTLTYGEVAKKILLLHAVFKGRSIKPGEKIALIGPNSTNWAIVYLATIIYGAVIVPILSDFHDDDIQHILIHSESRVLFAIEAIAAKIDEERMDKLTTVVSLNTLELISYKDRQLPGKIREIEEEEKEKTARITPESFTLPPDRNDSELAALVYTSGTSGFSKGVMLPYRSLMANTIFAQENLRLDIAEQTLSFLPLAHSYASAFDLLFPFTVGCHITFLGQMPSPKILIEAFAEVKPSLILFVPMILEKLYKKKLAPLLSRRSMKILLKTPLLSRLIAGKIRGKLTETFGGNFKEIMIGGAALNAEVEDFLKKIKLPVTVGYGMTECGPLISYSPWYEHRARSVGKAITPVELKIDSGDQLHQVGEIMVRGENVMLGYYKNNEATREVLDEEGWLRSGDLGVVDKDGFIYIRGRSKSLILGPSGQNIYPEEIESKLNVMPYVQESLVISDNVKLVALVYPDWDAVDAEKGEHGDNENWLRKQMEEVRSEVNIRLPAYSRIAAIRLHGDAFEKTPTHKIKRYRYS